MSADGRMVAVTLNLDLIPIVVDTDELGGLAGPIKNKNIWPTIIIIGGLFVPRNICDKAPVGAN